LHGGSGHELGLQTAKGLWVCRAGCGGGDAIDLVQRVRGCDFQGALVWLAEWSGTTPVAIVQAPSAEASRVDPAPLLRALWGLVATLPLGPAVCAYLGRRGVDPSVAHALGCRDWSGVLGEIRSLAAAHGAEMVEAAGLGDAGRWWWPLREQSAAPPGIAVPVWRPANDFPARWRWRLLSPTPQLKTLSCYSAGGMVDLVGVRGPVRPDRGPRTLLVVEGEPDWWSATAVAGPRAHVVGVCGAADRWRDAWPPMDYFVSRGVERVVVAVHRGKPLAICPTCSRMARPGDAVCKCGVSLAGADVRRHGEVLAESITWAATGAGIGEILGLLPEEGRDLNDLHRAGRLERYLARVL